MKSFLKTSLALLLANVVLAAILFVFFVAIGASMKSGKKVEVKDGSYLVMDIYGEVLAYDPPESFPESLIGDKPETLHRILTNLEKARVDDRIKGVIIKISSNNGLGMAMIEEIRNEIGKLRSEGKPVYSYSDFLDRKSLFLAAACDSIFLAPPGELYYVGYAMVSNHIKGTLEKLDIDADIHKIKDYKSAAEMVTRKDMSPESREMRQWIMEDIWRMEMADVTKDLGISENELIEHMKYALFTAEEAKEAGFVDAVLYWDGLKELLKDEDDEKLRTVSQSDYAKITRESVGLKGKQRIAVVHAHGMIGGRKSRIDPMLGMVMGHETVAANIREAGEDDKVAAVVFRVDSQGGEALTSDLIGHAVEEVAAKKPVIVSMIDVAASGGYSISYRATKMIADPMTITGSIGSISGKFNVAGFYNKLGVTFDYMGMGPNGFLFSDKKGFTEEQRKRFEANHWNGFNRWLQDVADRRGMTFEEAELLAGGRVWTGHQAKENGLIDDVGGLDRAIEVAKEEAGVDAGEEVTLVHYPKRKGLLAMITGGNSPLSTAFRWTLYRFIHHDLEESYRLLTTAAVNTWTVRAIEEDAAGADDR